MSSSLCLTQVVSEPTHVLSNSHSLIDLVFLSDPSHLTGCVTIPALANSDHLGLLVSISAGNPGSLPKRKSWSIWRYSHANFDPACELLDSTDWDSIFATNDVSSCWANWHSHFLKIMEECIPKVTLRSRPNLPWLTKTVTQANRRRNFLFRAAKHSGRFFSEQQAKAAVPESPRHLDSSSPPNPDITTSQILLNPLFIAHLLLWIILLSLSLSSLSWMSCFNVYSIHVQLVFTCSVHPSIRRVDISRTMAGNHLANQTTLLLIFCM